MQEEINKFLEMTNGSIEPCLMITKDESELTAIENEVNNFGFKKTRDAEEIFNGIKSGNKIYFIFDKTFENDLYNILTQYSTGQINIYDGQENFVTSPDYKKGSVLILITKVNLEKIEASQMSLLRIVGLTWQN